MKHLLLIIPLAACSIPDDYAGTVTQYSGDALTIRGSWDGTLQQKPTPAMAALADGLCAPNSSELISAARVVSDGLTSGGYFTDFLFACRAP